MSQNRKSIIFIFNFCLWIIECSAYYELRIKPFKSELEASVGSSAVFTCEVCEVGGSDDVFMVDSGVAKIQWMKVNTGREIKAEKGRVFVENDGTKIRKLFLKHIHESDAGEYRCSVRANNFVDSKSIKLTVFKDISFDHVPNPQHPRIHTTAVIECQASSHPPPVMSWKFNGNAIIYGAKYKQVARGLQVSNISRKDNGNYTCSAEVGSEGRYEEKRITVVVHVPPMMVFGSTRESGTEGNEMSLFCRAESDPMPSYEFYRVGRHEKLLTSSPSDRVQVDSHLGRITFKPLRSEDSGTYRCRAVNDAGEASANISLHVLVPPMIYEFKNKTVQEGEAVTVTCKTKGEPNPYMTFQKHHHNPFTTGLNDNDKIMISNRVPNIIEMKIINPQPHHNGLYVCSSENAAGVTNASAFLNVYYKPRFSSNHSKEEYSWSGRVHNITCQAHANPPATFHWIKNNLPLTNNDTFTIINTHRNSSLQIRTKEADQGWIFGEYFCKVSNPKGNKELKIKLLKAALPGAPSDVRVVEQTPTTVTLEVKPPKMTGGVRLLGYRVEFRKKITDFALNETASLPSFYGYRDVSGSFLTIRNLKPETNYNLLVRAKNEMGVGDPERVIFTTTRISKPFPIKLISPSESKSPWSYKLKWEKPKTGGKPVIEYEIRYKKVRVRRHGEIESLEGWKVEKIKDNYYHPHTHHTIHHLEPDTTYQFQVFATTQLGRSLNPEMFVAKTADKALAMGSYIGSSSKNLLSAFLLNTHFFVLYFF